MGHQVGSIQPVEQPKPEEKISSPKLILVLLRTQRFEWGQAYSSLECTQKIMRCGYPEMWLPKVTHVRDELFSVRGSVGLEKAQDKGQLSCLQYQKCSIHPPGFPQL